MRHNRTEGVRYNRANSRIPAPDAFGQAPAERMAVHMLCDTCGRKKAAVFYHENIGGRVRTFNLCPACADAMKRSGELEDFSDACAGPGEPVLCPEEPVLHELPIPAAVGTNGAPGLLCPRCGGSLSDLAASGGAGCAVCYTVFAAELAPLLPTFGGRLCHAGAVPAGYRARQERAERAAANTV